MPANRSELAALFVEHGLDSFLNSTHTLIVLLNEDGKLIVWNPAFDSIKQALPDVIHLRDFLSLPSRTIFDLLLSTVTHDRLKSQGELDLGQGDHLSEYFCFLYPVENGRVLFVAEPAHVNSDSKTSAEEQPKTQPRRKLNALEQRARLPQTRELSSTDTLTSLPNRRQITAELQEAVNFSNHFGTPLSILMLDVDHFKKINDAHGHIVGDEILRTLAGRLRELTHPSDAIGRYGGEEFLIVMPHHTLTSAVEYASRLCQQVRTLSISVHELHLSVTLSAGIARYKIGREDWQSLLNRADQALSLAKERGRDRWSAAEE